MANVNRIVIHLPDAATPTIKRLARCLPRYARVSHNRVTLPALRHVTPRVARHLSRVYRQIESAVCSAVAPDVGDVFLCVEYR